MTPTPNNNQSYSEVIAGLALVERRLRLQEAARLAPWAAATALAVGVVLGVVGRFWPLLDWPLMLLADAGLVLLALLGVFLYAWLRPRARLTIARRGDSALDLEERLATAVESEESARAARRTARDAAAFAQLNAAQLSDASASLSAALPDLQQRLPLAPPQRTLFLPAALVLLLVIAFVAPNPATAFFQQQQAVQQQEKDEAQKIEELQKSLVTLPQDANVQALAAELQSLQDDLAAGDMTREEAMARLSEAEAQLQKLVDQQAPGARAALDSLGRQLSEQQGALGEAGKDLQKGDTAKAADDIKKAGQELDSMTPEQRAALAQALRAAAAELANNDPSLAQRLNDAAQALDSGDPQAAQKALDNLSDAVRQSGQNLATQDQIDQALAQVQDSKQNIAQAGAAGTPIAGGTPLAGTPIAFNGTPISTTNGTPISGTMMAINPTPISGTLALTGTPVVMPGQGGTPVAGNNGQPGQSAGPGGPGNSPGNSNNPGVSNQAGSGHQEPVAVPPSTLNAQGTPVGVQARPNDGDTSVTGVNTSPSGGSASVPYSDVYGSYNQSAEQTLQGDYIPQGMKDLVRQYFSSIDPGQ